MLVEKGRLALGQDVGQWLDNTLGLPPIKLVPIEPAIAVDSVRLPGDFHADPADRLIVATSRAIQAPLMTADQAILNYSKLGYVTTFDASR